jgi:hypothetical protein
MLALSQPPARETQPRSVIQPDVHRFDAPVIPPRVPIMQSRSPEVADLSALPRITIFECTNPAGLNIATDTASAVAVRFMAAARAHQSATLTLAAVLPLPRNTRLGWATAAVTVRSPELPPFSIALRSAMNSASEIDGTIPLDAASALAWDAARLPNADAPMSFRTLPLRCGVFVPQVRARPLRPAMVLSERPAFLPANESETRRRSVVPISTVRVAAPEKPERTPLQAAARV